MSTAESKTEQVEVTLTVTDANGTTSTQEKEIAGGSTAVTTLKQELGVAEADSLFLVREGKKKLLVDHEHHNVKEDDHFEVVSKGGVS